jgi:hypothetical protein
MRILTTARNRENLKPLGSRAADWGADEIGFAPKSRLNPKHTLLLHVSPARAIARLLNETRKVTMHMCTAPNAPPPGPGLTTQHMRDSRYRHGARTPSPDCGGLRTAVRRACASATLWVAWMEATPPPAAPPHHKRLPGPKERHHRSGARPLLRVQGKGYTVRTHTRYCTIDPTHAPCPRRRRPPPCMPSTKARGVSTLC